MCSDGSCDVDEDLSSCPADCVGRPLSARRAGGLRNVCRSNVVIEALMYDSICDEALNSEAFSGDDTSRAPPGV